MPVNMINSPIIDDASRVRYELPAEENVGTFESTLDLDIDEKDFIDYFKKFQRDFKAFYGQKAYNLNKRVDDNYTYRFARQVQNTQFKAYNARYIDPVIYDAESYLKPIALSRLPDITVKPSQNNEQSKLNAELLSKVVNSDLQSRERKRALGLAFQHLPVYYTGIIKAFWNPEIGKHGDYDFVAVLPTEVIFDWTSRSNNPDDMSLVAQAVEYTVEEWVMRFPDKEEELYQELRKQGTFTDKLNENTKAGMNTAVKGWEIWFHWYERAKGGEFERLDGVAWVYEDCLLKRMKNPYWDWTGEAQTFSYEESEAGASSENPEQANQNSLLGLPTPQQQVVYHNHFDFPRKPFIFLGYDQWGKQPLDETSRIEMSLYLQQNMDKRGRQMAEMWDRVSGKHVWSTAGGLKKSSIEEMDLNDPDQDIFVEGNVNETHSFVPGEQPSPEMLASLNREQQRVFEIIGVNGAIMGQSDEETATQTQISREGAFTRADDLVDETINYASEQMANWILQFIKLFYTEEHLRKLIGSDGSVLYAALTRDMVEDGMEIIISASGTDKLKAKQDAFDMAKIQLIDPLTFYEDIDVSDPKGRAERLIAFMSNPAGYSQQYLTEEGGGGRQQAMMDIAQLQAGQTPTPPQTPSDDYLNAITNFLNSPGFAQLPPQQKAAVLQHGQQALAGAQNMPPAPTPPFASQAPGAGGPVGPITANPQPGNTQQVNVLPPTFGGGNV